MTGRGGTDWGSIGRIAVITSLLAAVVTFFAVPDDRWISLAFLGVAFFDGLAFTMLFPRLAGRRAAPSELDRESAEPAEPGSDPERDFHA